MVFFIQSNPLVANSQSALFPKENGERTVTVQGSAYWTRLKLCGQGTCVVFGGARLFLAVRPSSVLSLSPPCSRRFVGGTSLPFSSCILACDVMHVPVQRICGLGHCTHVTLPIQSNALWTCIVGLGASPFFNLSAIVQ